MKSIIVSLCSALLIPLISFAGPEDRHAYETCFTLVDQDQRAPRSVPQNLCLEAIYLSLGPAKIAVYSYSNSDVFSNMILKKIENTEGGFAFEAEKVISGFSEGTCKASEVTSLILSGPTNSVGIANMNELKVSVTHTATPDSCHSDATTLSFTYKKN